MDSHHGLLKGPQHGMMYLLLFGRPQPDDLSTCSDSAWQQAVLHKAPMQSMALSSI